MTRICVSLSLCIGFDSCCASNGNFNSQFDSRTMNTCKANYTRHCMLFYWQSNNICHSLWLFDIIANCIINMISNRTHNIAYVWDIHSFCCVSKLIKSLTTHNIYTKQKARIDANECDHKHSTRTVLQWKKISIRIRYVRRSDNNTTRLHKIEIKTDIHTVFMCKSSVKWISE